MNSFRTKVISPIGVIFLAVIQTSALGVNFDPSQEAIEWALSDSGNGHIYEIVILEDIISWDDANQVALSRGGYLVTLKTPEENQFITSAFQFAGSGQSWIGLRQDRSADDYEEPASGWYWVTGEPLGWSNWRANEPGDGGGIGEDWANIWFAGGDATNPSEFGTWNDNVLFDIHRSDSFIIEWSDDCNNDGLVDYGQILDGTVADIDSNGIPDCCEGGPTCDPDCDGDGTSDADEISNGEAGDVNQNGLPDNCEPDCDGDGIPDFVEIEFGSFDCNVNTIPDECEIADGSSVDSNSNGFIDACELDCNGNTFFDFVELDLGLVEDCDQNRVPDECDIADGSQSDCNLDGIPDSCVPFDDCDSNGVPDECQIDTDQDGSIDACDADDDGDDIPDECDVDSFVGPEGAQYWDPAEGGNGHWYMGTAAPGISWEDAAAQAEALGGYLCTVPSAEENIWVFINVASDPSLWNTWFGPWIGGYQDTSSPEYSEPDGAWSWVTGEPWSYTNWGPGDPSNTGGQDHAAFGGIPSDEIRFTWNDIQAPYAGGFITEWSGASDCNGNGVLDSCEVDTDLDGIPDECDPDVDGDGIPNGCDVDTQSESPYADAVYWNPSVGGNGHWYSFVDDRWSWDDATQFAGNLGGHLATVTSSEEDIFVTDLIPDPLDDWAPMIGGFQDFSADDFSEPAGGWRWVTGEVWEYSRWASGNPSDSNSGEDYLEIMPNEGWNDTNGTENRGIIVEWSRTDCNANGVLDSCEDDSDTDGIIDECDPDDDNDGVPDECDPESTGGFDCDANGIDDVCELGDDCNSNLIPDRCESDLDEDGAIDDCDLDDDGDGVPDECDPRWTGGEDCDANGFDDTCESDLDEDGTIDACDPDIDGDGISNECDVSPGEPASQLSCCLQDGTCIELTAIGCATVGGFIQPSDTDCETAACPNVFGADWFVDDDFVQRPDADFSSIQDAVDAAQSGDTIVVYPGTYRSSTSDMAINITDKDLILYGFGAEGEVLIDGQGAQGFLRCVGQVSRETLVRGFTFTGGWDKRFLVHLFGVTTSPEIRECKFVSTNAEEIIRSGPPGAPLGGSGLFRRCKFTDVTCANRGVYADYSSLEFEACDFINIQCGSEFFFTYDGNASVTFERCTFNAITANSGNLFSNTSGGSATAFGCVFEKNSSPNGTIFDSATSILSSIFCDNVSPLGNYVDLGGNSDCSLTALQWNEDEGGNGHWYQYVDSFGQTWEDINALSASVNANLVVPTTEAENAYLKSLVPDSVEFSFWMGAVRNSDQSCSTTSGWSWVTGEAWDYTEWGDVQPECYGSQQFLVMVRGDYRPGWHDYSPTTDIPYAVFEWSADCNNDGVVDYGQILDGTFADEDQNGVPDCCDQGVPCSSPSGEDCNGNGVLDSCELEDNDCNANEIPDDCEGFEDCNGNGTGDVCDIASGASQDINQDGVPDECQCIADFISDGVVDFQEVLGVLNDWGPCGLPCPPDINADGEVGFIDLLRVLDAWGPCDP